MQEHLGPEKNNPAGGRIVDMTKPDQERTINSSPLGDLPSSARSLGIEARGGGSHAGFPSWAKAKYSQASEDIDLGRLTEQGMLDKLTAINQSIGDLKKEYEAIKNIIERQIENLSKWQRELERLSVPRNIATTEINQLVRRATELLSLLNQGLTVSTDESDIIYETVDKISMEVVISQVRARTNDKEIQLLVDKIDSIAKLLPEAKKKQSHLSSHLTTLSAEFDWMSALVDEKYGSKVSRAMTQIKVKINQQIASIRRP